MSGFLPKNRFEQVQKKANALVAIISLTPLSPKTPIVSVAPLVLVLTVSAIKEAVEDWQRYKMDRKTGTHHGKPAPKQCGPVALGSGFEPMLWSDLMVGDVVFIREGGAFPADILLLQSSTDQGIANIETANLDGETNLKTKQANPECWRIPVGDSPAHKRRNSRSITSRNRVGIPSARGPHVAPKSKDEIHGLKWPLKLPPLVIESAAPSKKLDGSAWKANMTFLRPPADFADESAASSSSASGMKRGETKMALGMSQLLLRGRVLRNTKWIVGVVIFTGVETKLMLNNRKAALKRSQVDRIVDQSLYILFAIEFVLCTLGASLNYAWMDANRHLWFLPPLRTMQRDAGLSFFTYLVLLDILIPISLYVSMELVKAAQAYLINVDLAMYHAATDTPAHARTSNLNEELGQIEYVFSDKTGTLTCNVMNFVACSVEGREYGMDALRRAKAGSAAGGKSGSPQAQEAEAWTMPSLPGLPPLDADFPFRDLSLVRSLLDGGGGGGGRRIAHRRRRPR